MRRTTGSSLVFLLAASCGGGTSSNDAGPDYDAAPTVPDAAPDAEVDTTPPGAVTALSANATPQGVPSVDLSWTNPGDADLAGVLIVRSSGGGATPVDGTSYAVGDTLSGGTVAFAGPGASAEDAPAPSGVTSSYELFAYDDSHNYSGGAATTARPGIYYAAVITAAGSGAATVEPAPGSVELDLMVNVISGGGLVGLAITFTNLADRQLMNPKLMLTDVSSGMTTNSDGVIDGVQYRYFGPGAIQPGAQAPARTWSFSGATFPLEVGVELRLDSMLFVSHQSSPPVTLIDTGANRVVLDAPAAGISARFSTVSNSDRFLWLSRAFDSGIDVIDLAGDTLAASVTFAPEGAGSPVQVSQGGLVASPDGTVVYAAVSSQQPSGASILFLAEVSTATHLELRRVVLGTSPPVGGTVARGLAVDFTAGRAYVPMYRGSRVHVVDLTGFAQVDMDGNSANGITPITFDAEHEAASGVAVNPDGTHLFVTFGRHSSTDVADIDLAAPTAITFLPVTSPASASSPRPHFAPDGRLFVPRIGYPRSPGDPDAFGISVFDLGATPVTESFVNVGSDGTGNNDLWDVAFLERTNLAYAMKADSSQVMVFDTVTLEAVDIDGIAMNGVTHIQTTGSSYGGCLSMTSFPY